MVVLFVTSLLGAMAPVAGAESGPSLAYTVRVQPGQPTIHVTLDSTGSGGSFVLRLREDAKQGKAGIHNLTASSGGAPVSLSEFADARWQVGGAGSSVTFEYDVDRVVMYQGGDQLAIYASDTVAYLMGPYLFLYPEFADASSITLRFVVPSDWKVVTPYLEDGNNTFHPQRITISLIEDFVARQQIYMGRMRFYAEAPANATTVRFGVPEGDRNAWETATYLDTQAKVQAYADLTGVLLQGLAEVYGYNPYSVFTMHSNFMPKPTGPMYAGTRYFGNGYQFWGDSRADYVSGHMVSALVGGTSPLRTSIPLWKGVGELYYGIEVAWRKTGDPVYHARMYHYYLAYDRMWNAPGLSSWSDYDDQIKPMMVATLLDREIRNATNDASSLDTAMQHLASVKRNVAATEPPADWANLETSIRTATGYDSRTIFSRYVEGNERIPIDAYFAPYKGHFLNYSAALAEGFFSMDYGGTLAPAFVLMELAAQEGGALIQGGHLTAIVLDTRGYLGPLRDDVKARYTASNLTEASLESAISSFVDGDATGFFHRWDSTYGTVSFSELRDWIFRDTTGRGQGNGTGGFRIEFTFQMADGTPLASTELLYGRSASQVFVPLGTTDAGGRLGSTNEDLVGTRYFSTPDGRFVASAVVPASGGTLMVQDDSSGSGPAASRTPGFDLTLSVAVAILALAWAGRRTRRS